MRYRQLRIAWSALWGVAAVLLIVLWVRSYWWSDVNRINHLAFRAVDLDSNKGGVTAWAGEDRDFLWMWDGYSAPASGINRAFEFQLTTTRNDILIAMPYWAIICGSISVGAIPWLPWWSSRFSLRALLIATTLVAVVLGVVVWAVR